MKEFICYLTDTTMNSKTRIKCKQCGELFSRKDSLKRHVDNIHTHDESSESESEESSQENDEDMVSIPRKLIQRIIEKLEEFL